MDIRDSQIVSSVNLGFMPMLLEWLIAWPVMQDQPIPTTTCHLAHSARLALTLPPVNTSIVKYVKLEHTHLCMVAQNALNVSLVHIRQQTTALRFLRVSIVRLGLLVRRPDRLSVLTAQSRDMLQLLWDSLHVRCVLRATTLIVTFGVMTVLRVSPLSMQPHSVLHVNRGHTAQTTVMRCAHCALLVHSELQ